MMDIYILNLEQVDHQFEEFTEKVVPGAVREQHMKIAMKVLQGCVMGTPVDKGTARGGWDVSERGNSELTGRQDKVGATTVQEGNAKIMAILSGRLSEYTVIYIQNNVHYIGILENTHHSPQNSGWVKATIAAVEAGL